MSGTRCNATSACPISTVRTGSASCHRNRISRCSLTESASTNFDAHSPAPQSRKVDISPTHFVHPQSWPPTTLNQTFSHRKAERSGSDQLFLSFNPRPPREGVHRTRHAPASFISTRSGRSHVRTRPRGARHCRESVRETGGERSRGRVRLHRTFQQEKAPGRNSD